MLKQAKINGVFQSKLIEYRVWNDMIQRCYNPKNKRYADWGGRGITVCDRWRNSFLNFLEDMGRRPPGPPGGIQIDRRDNEGNYEPGNCQWVTRQESMANRRPYRTNGHTGASRSATVTLGGVTKSLWQWSADLDIHYETLAYRFSKNWPPEKLLSTTRFQTTNSKADRERARLIRLGSTK